jgi:hypothetical protein
MPLHYQRKPGAGAPGLSEILRSTDQVERPSDNPDRHQAQVRPHHTGAVPRRVKTVKQLRADLEWVGVRVRQARRRR